MHAWYNHSGIMLTFHKQTAIQDLSKCHAKITYIQNIWQFGSSANHVMTAKFTLHHGL